MREGLYVIQIILAFVFSDEFIISLKSMSSILCPLNKLPNRQECTILIVGDEGSGKHELGLSMLNLKTPFSLNIRTATSLPLPEKNDSSRPRIDYIAYIVNITVENSLKAVESSLSKVDVKYFVGKSCLIVTGVEYPNKRVIEMDTVTKLAESYDLPIIFGEVQIESELNCLASKLNKILETAGGFKRNMSPMLIDATRRDFEQDL